MNICVMSIYKRGARRMHEKSRERFVRPGQQFLNVSLDQHHLEGLLNTDYWLLLAAFLNQ